ncbi:AI-2E family transporter [Parahaliea mediterranea]|uniref:AI-2E family transporter n=1 Tax=Parahaliea mediterranea TaxID=651086 RepID=UPI001F4EAF0E|nr:AI-2E family transporter [Parahaliea mediterranea]
MNAPPEEPAAPSLLGRPRTRNTATARTHNHSPGGVALAVLASLAVLYTLYFASSLLIPVVVALLFSLLLSPLVNTLKRFHVPRSISAMVLLACIGGPIALLGMELAEPAQKWAKRLPEIGMELTEELDSLTESLKPPQQPAQAPLPAPAPAPEARGFNWFGWFDDDEPAKATSPAPTPQEQQQAQGAVTERLMQGGLELVISFVSAAPFVLVQLLTFVILVLFQLSFGPRLWESAIEIFPRVRDKRQASLIVARVQRELSRYILTVSLINIGLGVTTAAALWLLQVEDALLWGALVGLLNFAPYVGPLVAVCVLALAGLVQYGLEGAALIPVLAYFTINLLEAQLITPLVLGRNMRLNPLVLVLWLIVWGWLWGAAGVLLAVPLLVCLKLAAQQLGVMEYWVRLIETRA